MYALYLNGKPVKREGYFTDLVTDKAIEFMEKQREGSPFFLYVPFTAPHSPYQGPNDYRPEALPEGSDLWDQSKGPRDIYFAMIERMDQCIGNILKKLEERELADNTLVVFMSDNGASRSGSNLPLSGYKGNLFEGGIRVPCIAKWPGVLPEGIVSDQACITMDFSKSIVGAAGSEPPKSRPFDGIDILRAIATNQPVQERTLFWRARRGQWTRRAVRDGSLKYIMLQNGDDVEEYLFDLNEDPAEKSDLESSRKEDMVRLKMLLRDWEEQVRHRR
jgi:N-acetylgalactosamine-6-sulfatase